MDEAPIGILYEHPLWFRPLFAELKRRGIRYELPHVNELVFDPGERELPYGDGANPDEPVGVDAGGTHKRFSTACTSWPIWTRSGPRSSTATQPSRSRSRRPGSAPCWRVCASATRRRGQSATFGS